MNRAERAATIALCADLSMRRQWALIGLAALRGLNRRTPKSLALMRWIDEQYLATRFVGRPGDSWALAADDGGLVKLRQTGHQVNRKPCNGCCE